MATLNVLTSSRAVDEHHHQLHLAHLHHRDPQPSNQHGEWADMESLKVACSSIMDSSHYSSIFNDCDSGGSGSVVSALSPTSSKYSSFDEQHTSKRSSSACTLSSHDSSDVFLLGGFLERKSYRPFRSNEEYLVAMKEDLAEWLNALYQDLDLNADNFINRLETGAILCRHANTVLRRLRQFNETNSSQTLSLTSVQAKKFPTLSMLQLSRDVPVKVNALPATFQARDNIANFIEWCRRIRIHDCLLFETEDLVARKNVKSFVLCLLEVARFGAQFGLLAPTLVQFEQEIDQELEKEQQQQQQQQSALANDAHEHRVESKLEEEESNVDQPQITNNDLESLHEKVVNLLSRCTCPVQFYLEHLSEGKYRIGDNRTLIFVRILRNHVMVRVGGGWDTLEHYLEKHDPCRCRVGHRYTGSARVTSTTVSGGSAFKCSTPGLSMQVTYERPELSASPSTVSTSPVSSNSTLNRPHRSLASIQCSPTPSRRRVGLIRPTSVTHNLNHTGEQMGNGHSNCARRVSLSSSSQSSSSSSQNALNLGSLSSNPSLSNLGVVADRNNNIKSSHANSNLYTPQLLKPKKTNKLVSSTSASHANLEQIASNRSKIPSVVSITPQARKPSNLTNGSKLKSTSVLSIPGAMGARTGSMLALNTKIPSASSFSAKFGEHHTPAQDGRESLPDRRNQRRSSQFGSRYASHTHLDRLGDGKSTPSARTRNAYTPVRQRASSNTRVKPKSSLDLTAQESRPKELKVPTHKPKPVVSGLHCSSQHLAKLEQTVVENGVEMETEPQDVSGMNGSSTSLESTTSTEPSTSSSNLDYHPPPPPRVVANNRAISCKKTNKSLVNVCSWLERN